MTSPGHDGDFPVPDLAVSSGPQGGASTENAIGEALSRLDGIHELPVAEHVEHFEAVHSALTDALNKAENLLSGSTSNGS